MTFLSIIIALHTCYVDLSIAFGLMLLGNPNLGPTIQRGAKTIPGLSALVILIAFVPISLDNKGHMGSAPYIFHI